MHPTSHITCASLLHLVGCIIFVDKSVISISVSYMLLFDNLKMCGK